MWQCERRISVTSEMFNKYIVASLGLKKGVDTSYGYAGSVRAQARRDALSGVKPGGTKQRYSLSYHTPNLNGNSPLAWEPVGTEMN